MSQDQNHVRMEATPVTFTGSRDGMNNVEPSYRLTISDRYLRSGGSGDGTMCISHAEPLCCDQGESEMSSQKTDNFTESREAEPLTRPVAYLVWSDLSEFDSHPVSTELARESADAHVGVSDLRHLMRWRRKWWDLLRSPISAEECLTCERMINAISVAIGMSQPDRARKLRDINQAKRQRQEVADRAAAEADAVAAWQDFRRPA